MINKEFDESTTVTSSSSTYKSHWLIEIPYAGAEIVMKITEQIYDITTAPIRTYTKPWRNNYIFPRVRNKIYSNISDAKWNKEVEGGIKVDT